MSCIHITYKVKGINTTKRTDKYSLENITSEQKDCLIKHIKYNPAIVEILIDNDTITKWIRKMPKDIWSNQIETKLKSLNDNYISPIDNDILERKIVWIGIKQMNSEVYNSMILEMHSNKSINIDDFQKNIFLETMEKVVLDEDFYNYILNYC